MDQFWQYVGEVCRMKLTLHPQVWGRRAPERRTSTHLSSAPSSLHSPSTTLTKEEEVDLSCLEDGEDDMFTMATQQAKEEEVIDETVEEEPEEAKAEEVPELRSLDSSEFLESLQGARGETRGKEVEATEKGEVTGEETKDKTRVEEEEMKKEGSTKSAPGDGCLDLETQAVWGAEGVEGAGGEEGEASLLLDAETQAVGAPSAMAPPTMAPPCTDSLLEADTQALAPPPDSTLADSLLLGPTQALAAASSSMSDSMLFGPTQAVTGASSSMTDSLLFGPTQALAGAGAGGLSDSSGPSDSLLLAPTQALGAPSTDSSMAGPDSSLRLQLDDSSLLLGPSRAAQDSSRLLEAETQVSCIVKYGATLSITKGVLEF